jgi:hypothetical protein
MSLDVAIEEKDIKHLIILNITPDSYYWDLFRYLSTPLDVPIPSDRKDPLSQKVHLVFDAYHVDFSHHQYFSACVRNPHTQQRLNISFPHNLVLLVTDPILAKSGIGYVLPH